MCSIWSILALSLVITLAYGQGLKGGITDTTIALDHPAVKYMVNGINAMYAKQGDNGVRTIKRLVNVRSQVVSGKRYEITIEVTYLEKTYECKAIVWAQIWKPVPYQFNREPTCSEKVVY